MAFDVQDSSGCLRDYVEIDGQRYCGDQTGLVLRIPFISLPVIEMRFHSDSSVQATGFNIRVRQLDQQATTARKSFRNCHYFTDINNRSGMF